MANLNTHTEVRDEGNWDYVGWSPRITSSGAMDTFVDGLITRANAWLRKAVGLTWYGNHVAVDPWPTLLKAAEMHLAQYYLCLGAALTSENGSDTAPSPFLGTGAAFLAVAKERMAQAMEIVALAKSES